MANPKKIIRQLLPTKGIQLLEDTYRTSRGVFWQTRYAFPARGMRVIAITGTNGKTTTSSYVAEVLKACGQTVAVYTTAYYEIAGERVPNRSHMTVTSQADVQGFFAKARKAHVDFVILEVTSHALDQGRIAGVPVEIAIMTNLTQDHLDYHKTMEAYAAAKALLFSKYKPKFSILNRDDAWYDFFAERATGEQISYGEHAEANLRLTGHDSTASGSSFTARYNNQHIAGTTNLVGMFNIYNALAATATGLALGFDQSRVSQGVAALTTVPGRMEAIDAGQKFQVLVDFAYTPDALLNALTTLRAITPVKGKIHIVFGATGDRDATKRPDMGKVVAKHADVIYLTDDETYTEDPQSIRDAVYEGIKAGKGTSKTQVFDDRLEAIKKAFKDAKPGDVVLLAGIGHEDYRNMGGKKLPWDERTIAYEQLKLIDK